MASVVKVSKPAAPVAATPVYRPAKVEIRWSDGTTAKVLPNSLKGWLAHGWTLVEDGKSEAAETETPAEVLKES